MVIIKNVVEGEVKIERIFCRSHSHLALWWVKSKNKLWKAWVQRRMEKIRKNVGKDIWSYVKMNENLADIRTREKSLRSFNEIVRYGYGAEFLYNNEPEWPSQEFIISKVDEIEEKSNGECILI